MKKVFVWGCYWQGNFGDDLMAIMIADYLSSHGYQVKVFRLQHDLALKYGFSVVKDVEEGVCWSDFVVLGGGAFLQRKIPLKYRLFSPSMRDIYKELVALHDALASYKKPFSFCSIGSSGGERYHGLDPIVRRVLELDSLVGGSVRLPGDVLILEEKIKSVPIKYIPDILFSTYGFMEERYNFNFSSREGGKIRIGVNLSRRDLATAKKIIQWYRENKSSVDVFFLLTHSESSGINSEYRLDGGEIASVCNHDPLAFARFISGLDLIVSVKLHLGLVAMSSGVEFISFNGQEKTVSQLSLVGMGNNIIKNDRDALLGCIDYFCDNFNSHNRSVDDLRDGIGAARGHLEFLNELLVAI